MTKDEVLKLALSTLDEVRSETFRLMRNGQTLYAEEKVWSAIIAIKEALAQPEQLREENERLHVENRRLIDRIKTIGVPVGVGGWLTTTTSAQPEQKPVGQLLEDAFGRGQVMWFNKPKDESMLYTTPPQRTWVGLIRGVRVEGDTVVITVKGGNDAARELCGEIINEMEINK